MGKQEIIKKKILCLCSPADAWLEAGGKGGDGGRGGGGGAGRHGEGVDEDNE